MSLISTEFLVHTTMWNAIKKGTVHYEPWSRLIGYCSPDADPGAAGVPRKVMPLTNVGGARLGELRTECRRTGILFGEDTAAIMTDGAVSSETILRKDVPPAEAAEIKSTSWRTRTRSSNLLHLVAAVAIALMVGCTMEGTLAFGKYFHVPKGDDQWRIIIDYRTSGRLCVVPPPINLPHIKTMLQEIAACGSTHAVTGDWSNFFYQLRLNPQLQLLFGLDCAGKFFRMLCLPMGWAWSPRLAQCVGWSVILHTEPDQDTLGVFETWGKDPPEFVRLREVKDGPTVGLIFLWIDNVMVIHRDPAKRDLWLDRLRDNAARFNLHWKLDTLKATDTPHYLGIFFKNENGVVRWQHELERIKKWKLPLGAQIVTARDVATLVGIIVWHHMVTLEPLLEAKACIDVLRRISSTTALPSKAAWDKPLTSLGIGISGAEASLLKSHVRKALNNPWVSLDINPATDVWYAVSDAAKDGPPVNDPFGVPPKRARETPSVKGCGFVWFGGGPQDIVHGHRVWTPEEGQQAIHILETEAVLWALTQLPAAGSHTRVILGVDNTVAVAAITKGYSSCSATCNIVRKIISLCKDKKYILEIVWVPTKENASDPCSRGADPTAARNQMSWDILHGAPPKTARVGRRTPAAEVHDPAVPIRDPDAAPHPDSDAAMISDMNHVDTLEEALLTSILMDDEDVYPM